jgi:hypothetical protein
LAALLLTAFAPPTAPRERYVPIGIEQGGDLGDNFYESWFGNQLRAMDEPILSRPGALGRFNMRLRILVLPTFQHGYAIRIDESAGGGLVSFVELTGAGGYAPGQVRRRTAFHLTAAEMRDVHRLVRQAGLESAPASVPEPPPIDTPDGQIVTVCADGTGYVVELVDRRGSRFVHRSDCGIAPPFQMLVNELLTLHPDARRAAR